MAKKKTEKKNWQALLTRQGGDRKGYNLYFLFEEPVPILIRLETVKVEGIISLRATQTVVGKKSALTKRVTEMIENGEAVPFEGSAAAEFNKRGSTQMMRKIAENMRWDGEPIQIPELTVDF